MIEFYPEIRFVHIAAVIASGSLFLLRGLALNAGVRWAGVHWAGVHWAGVHGAGARWAMAAPLRYLSYAIDTVLLTAALMLMTLVQQYPFVHGWLTAKVLLLIAYIVLGSFALRHGKTRGVRLVCFVAALLVYGFIAGIARAHHPLGILAGVFGA